MTTRIAFSTHYPNRMGELAGKPTRFPEKLITMIDPGGENENLNRLVFHLTKDGLYDFNFKVNYIPKTTTIRSNYEYWKSKEGQLIQPFFWAGKPYRSKQVVFCPEVRLAKVRSVSIYPDDRTIVLEDGMILMSDCGHRNFSISEGFDHPDHFWMWFDKYFNGALLELENVGG